jgi:hypothetical protein
MAPLTRRDDELAAPFRQGCVQHGVMTVIGPAAVASCRASIIDLIRGPAPVEILRVRLSEPDGVVVDSAQWQVGDRDPIDVAAEIAQYVISYGARVAATIVAWSSAK